MEGWRHLRAVRCRGRTMVGSNLKVRVWEGAEEMVEVDWEAWGNGENGRRWMRWGNTWRGR
jgi:hypothetical protein